MYINKNLNITIDGRLTKDPNRDRYRLHIWIGPMHLHVGYFKDQKQGLAARNVAEKLANRLTRTWEFEQFGFSKKTVN